MEGQAVSKVCEEHDLSPTLFYTWQKQFFENGEGDGTSMVALKKVTQDTRNWDWHDENF